MSFVIQINRIINPISKIKPVEISRLQYIERSFLQMFVR